MIPPPPADSPSIPHQTPTHTRPNTPSRVDPQPSFLDRPPHQRHLEYRYRCAQSVVFGLPVLALEVFGHSLGGPESDRWVALLQTLLAGWVIYVGAAGMLFEGLLWLARRRLTADLLPAAAAVALYALALWRTAPLVVPSLAPRPAPTFHWAVLTLVLWTGLRWIQMRTQARSTPEGAGQSKRPAAGPGASHASSESQH